MRIQREKARRIGKEAPPPPSPEDKTGFLFITKEVLSLSNLLVAVLMKKNPANWFLEEKIVLVFILMDLLKNLQLQSHETLAGLGLI